jgi:hypothetical protein
MSAPPPSELTSCKVTIPKEFVFDSRTYQNSATAVYLYKSTLDAQPQNVASGKKYQFKSDYERLQYLMGLYARTPASS